PAGGGGLRAPFRGRLRAAGGVRARLPGPAAHGAGLPGARAGRARRRRGAPRAAPPVARGGALLRAGPGTAPVKIGLVAPGGFRAGDEKNVLPALHALVAELAARH